MIVTALKNFEHDGPVRRGQTLNVTRAVANQLREKGLVSTDGLDADDTPPQANGEAPSSASPAARPSTSTTASASADGVTQAPAKTAKKTADKPAEKPTKGSGKKTAGRKNAG